MAIFWAQPFFAKQQKKKKKKNRLRTSGVFYCNKHNAVEFIMLFTGNFPLKSYSYNNIFPRNDLSYIFEFQLVPFAFSLIAFYWGTNFVGKIYREIYKINFPVI